MHTCYGQATAVTTDVTVAADVERAVDAARALGPLRALVLSAAIETRGVLLVDCSDEEWQRVLDVDLKGVFLGLRAAIPAIIDAGGGSAVVLGSPIGPLVIVVSGGGVVAVAIVHVRDAGVGSTFPATSTARTSNVCVPTASPL